MMVTKTMLRQVRRELLDRTYLSILQRWKRHLNASFGRQVQLIRYNSCSRQHCHTLRRAFSLLVAPSSSSSSPACFETNHHLPSSHSVLQERRKSWINSSSHCHLSTTTATSSSSLFSKREIAELEDRLWTTVGKQVYDPILTNQSLAQLQWMHRRISISSSSLKDDPKNNGIQLRIQLLLKLPSLLHPALDQLKQSVQQAAQGEVQQWLADVERHKHQPDDGKNKNHSITVNVEAIATPPVPFMARLFLEQQQEEAESNSSDNMKSVQDELLKSLGPGLASVSHFVAVYSCKGGVGKSTVAVNLAYELARWGGRVGLLDLDLYGPSLPVLIRPDDIAVRRSNRHHSDDAKLVLPIEHCGVKALSLGFVNQNSGVPGSGQGNGAAVMRGPMAGKVATQLLKGTDWGELDVLILDLPPGTGDIQLQLLQDVQVSGAIAVTTPSKLAAVDTRKGMEMLTSLGVPTIAVVENMTYFECEGGGKHYPFGHSLKDQPQKMLSLIDAASVIQLPISTIANEANDMGVPLCLSRPQFAQKELQAFESLARKVSAELLRLQFGSYDSNVKKVYVTFDPSESEYFDVATIQLSLNKTPRNQPRGEEMFTVRLFAESGAIQKRIPAVALRCRDPKTGEVIADSPFLEQARNAMEKGKAGLDPIVTFHRAGSEKVSPSVVPRVVQKKGRYGYSVQWDDGTTVIYSMQSIAAAAGGKIKQEFHG